MQLVDQLHRKINLASTPKRIVSLVPSITYTLHYLQLNNEVIGITQFCKLPENWRKEKTIIGGTKNVKIASVKALQPDFIIANKEENSEETVTELHKIAPVYVSDVVDICSNNLFLKDMGKIFSKESLVQSLINQIQQQVALRQNGSTKSKVAYLIWQEPWMSIGGDTFIHKMLQIAGYENIFKKEKRYPIVTISDIQKENPDVIFLSSEPFPFKEKHQTKLQKMFPNTLIKLVQGEAFTWFGAYTLQGLQYITNIKI